MKLIAKLIIIAIFNGIVVSDEPTTTLPPSPFDEPTTLLGKAKELLKLVEGERSLEYLIDYIPTLVSGGKTDDTFTEYVLNTVIDMIHNNKKYIIDLESKLKTFVKDVENADNEGENNTALWERYDYYYEEYEVGAEKGQMYVQRKINEVTKFLKSSIQVQKFTSSLIEKKVDKPTLKSIQSQVEYIQGTIKQGMKFVTNVQYLLGMLKGMLFGALDIFLFVQNVDEQFEEVKGNMTNHTELYDSFHTLMDTLDLETDVPDPVVSEATKIGKQLIQSSIKLQEQMVGLIMVVNGEIKTRYERKHGVPMPDPEDTESSTEAQSTTEPETESKTESQKEEL